MDASTIEQQLSNLFEQWSGTPAETIKPLAPSGSDRIYYRLQNTRHSAVGAYNSNRQENDAFLTFSQHFKKQGLFVPEIFAENLDQHIYLQEDLGDCTLYNLLPAKEAAFSGELLLLYKKSVEQLAKLQVQGGKELDFSKCFPRVNFDRQSMLWDFNYFKYYFLKLSGLDFDEQALEADVQTLIDFLLKADSTHFMFRDFQSRNIMIKDGEPFFIDYQGGRRGALQYDLASLLFQAKANIPADVRAILLTHYLDALEKHLPVNRETFTNYYYGFVLIRTIQVLGAYGFRGLYEGKAHFLQSIPFALKNVEWLFKEDRIKLELPTLKATLSKLVQAEKFQLFDKTKGAKSPLKVRVNSFSYKITGVPEDHSGNGGGFVFDCRFLHNPGRYQSYKKLTGRDESVINFLQHHSEMPAFLQNVFKMVDGGVENYIERNFENLQVNFGCTGGQHRSVYAADQLAKHLENKYGVEVILHHIEQEKKNWQN